MSKSQFHSDTIDVQGFSWCQEKKTIGIGSLVAKNLCRDHNGKLSPADAEAKKLLDALIQINRRTEEWKAGKRGPRIVRDIDAAKVEQWLLKTTFNMALQGRSHGGLFKDGEPNEYLVRIAFGLEEFAEPHGLYWIVPSGAHIPGSQMGSLKWESFVRSDTGNVVATQLDFHGHRLWLALPGASPRNDLSRGREIGFVETFCEIRLRWGKRRLRERLRQTGSS